jgi:hypothetical protein
MNKFALGCVTLALCLSGARADIIPSFSGVTDGNVGVTWTYTASVTVEQNANTGDFFTIYDFGSIVPNSNVQPAGWTLTTSLLGVNPAQTNVPDNPNVLNLTWTYAGPTIQGTTPAGQNMGPFSVQAFTRESRFSFFAAQGTLAQGPEAGSKVGNVGAIVVPVPEPSTIALIVGTGGLGLISRALLRRRKI